MAFDFTSHPGHVFQGYGDGVNYICSCGTSGRPIPSWMKAPPQYDEIGSPFYTHVLVATKDERACTHLERIEAEFLALRTPGPHPYGPAWEGYY